MSFVSTITGNNSVNRKQAHVRRAAVVDAVEALEGRQLLSAVGISSASVNEGGNLVYTVTLNQASASAVTVNYNIAGGTAKPNRDYIKAKPGKVTFAAGETSKTITVQTKDNHVFSANKTVLMHLQKPSKGNSIQGNGVGVGTIVNTDSSPIITINNARTTEGAKGTKILTFTVKMTGGAAETPVKVNYSTQDVSATSKGKTADYIGARKTLTFKAINKPVTIKIKIKGDTTPEADEAFRVNLSTANGSSATIVNPDVDGASYAVGSIVNDDGGNVSSGTTVSIFPTALSINPGASAGMMIMLNQISADPVTVHYSTTNGTLTAGSDFTATSGDVTFNPGELSKDIVVPTSAQAASGSFSVNLSSPSGDNSTVATGSATVNITAAPLPTLSVNDVSITEGDSGTKSLTFTVSLSSAAMQAVSVAYATGDGTATAGSDYTAASGMLTFAAGETSKTVNVPILGDTTVETDETFMLTLSQPVNAAITKSLGTGTIINDDAVTGQHTDPNDGQGLAFTQGAGNTTWNVNPMLGTQNSLHFDYAIDSTRSTPVYNAQVEIFLVTQGSDLATATPYKTVDIGTIAAGATVSGDVDGTGGPSPSAGQGYYARLVSEGVVYATDTGPGFTGI